MPDRFSMVYFLAFISIGVAGCETVRPEVTETTAVITQAQSARARAFAETLDTYSPAGADETQVIALLREYRGAFNASDLGRIEALLSSDFELRYADPLGKGKYLISAQGHTMYLEKRSAWSAQRPRGEQLIMNVRSVLLHAEGKGAVVVAATTYKSKYFHPRYIETFVLKKFQDGWRLRRILVFPAEPKLEELEIRISYANVDTDYFNDRDILTASGPDALFKKYIRVSCCLKRERQKTLIIFAEPPMKGASITVRETQVGGSGNTFASNVTRFFPRLSPYTLFLGVGWKGSGYRVDVEVEVDGVVVAKKTLR